MKILNEYLRLDGAADWNLEFFPETGEWRVTAKQKGFVYVVHSGYSEQVAKAIHAVPSFLEYFRRERDKLGSSVGDDAEDFRRKVHEAFLAPNF